MAKKIEENGHGKGGEPEEQEEGEEIELPTSPTGTILGETIFL
jgi:hypothetical protein